MSDYMLLEYLRNKGMRGDERELVNDFKRYMRAKGKMRGSRMHRDYEFDDMECGRHDWDMNYKDMYRNMSYRDAMSEDHFDEFEAKEIVSEMYHGEGRDKQEGEHFDMKKAEEVLMKYKHHMTTKVTPEDVYVAINATYHDFCGVLKSWFGSNIDEKVILLAITFWFKDDDYQGNKLMDYFE